MDINKLTLVVILVGTANNILGADQNSFLAEYFPQIIQRNSGKDCSIQAATNAFNCLRNTCVGSGSVPSDTIFLANLSSQDSCYSEYCGGLSCPLSANFFSNVPVNNEVSTISCVWDAATGKCKTS